MVTVCGWGGNEGNEGDEGGSEDDWENKKKWSVCAYRALSYCGDFLPIQLSVLVY